MVLSRLRRLRLRWLRDELSIRYLRETSVTRLIDLPVTELMADRPGRAPRNECRPA